MGSLFLKIVSGEIPSYKVAEDEHFLAFLDINPNAKGHTLCIPKKETDKLFDLSEQEFLDLMRFSRKVAKAIEKVVDCKRVGLSVIGLEVPHVHVHLIPLNGMQDAQFINKTKLEPAEFEQLAAQLNQAYKQQD
jgi:histidine triad (HIT) family protein